MTKKTIKGLLNDILDNNVSGMLKITIDNILRIINYLTLHTCS